MGEGNEHGADPRVGTAGCNLISAAPYFHLHMGENQIFNGGSFISQSRGLGLRRGHLVKWLEVSNQWVVSVGSYVSVCWVRTFPKTLPFVCLQTGTNWQSGEVGIYWDPDSNCPLLLPPVSFFCPDQSRFNLTLTGAISITLYLSVHPLVFTFSDSPGLTGAQSVQRRYHQSASAMHPTPHNQPQWDHHVPIHQELFWVLFPGDVVMNVIRWKSWYVVSEGSCMMWKFGHVRMYTGQTFRLSSRKGETG